MKPSLCPYCGYFIDTASNVKHKGDPPEEGDISMCLSCSEISIFKQDMSLRKSTPLDWADFSVENLMLIVRLKFAHHAVVPSKGLMRKEQKQ